jgi:hypothetical protein
MPTTMFSPSSFSPACSPPLGLSRPRNVELLFVSRCWSVSSQTRATSGFCASRDASAAVSFAAKPFSAYR